MNSKKDIFALVFWSLLIAATAYLSWLFAIISTILAFFIYAAISYLLYRLWKKIRKAEHLDPLEYLRLFAYKTATAFSLLAIILGWFVYYNNEISPAKMPTYYLSNGEKQLTFQAMIHIAHSDFYDRIEQDILFAKQDNYVYFFEWVKPGSAESHDAFNKALGIEFDADLYKNFSELYGVVAQDNAQFLWLENDLDFNVDMNMDEIMSIYKQKASPSDSTISPELLDVNKEIVTLLAGISPKQKKILVYVNQAILNFFTKNEALRNTILENLWNADIFAVILDDRNQLLADEIIQSEYNKIHVTYGLLHFNGVLELLQKNDPNWIINWVEYLFPIQ